MRHDAKLGLALGMLVIGFAVAFCFPRRPARVAEQTARIPAPISEGTLELLPIRAYQPEILASQTEPKSLVESTAVPQPLTPITIDGVPIAPVGLSPVAIPAPVANVQETLHGFSSLSQPVHEIAPNRTFPEAASPPRYVVKAGDTLTGIATRLLGSSSRYSELFHANQDILSSPNDLKIGMELRVPPVSPPSSADKPKENLAKQGQDPEQNTSSRPADGGWFQQPPPAPWIAERPVERR